MKRITAFLAISFAVGTPVHAQLAGGVASGTLPRVTPNEVSASVSVQHEATIVEAGYHMAFTAPQRLDIGLRVGAFSADGVASGIATAVETKYQINRANSRKDILPVDVAITAGLSVSMPGWKANIATVPVGVSIGGELPFNTGFDRPSYLYLYAHPRIEFSQQIEHGCMATSSFACRHGAAFRSDIGLSGDLSERTTWTVATGLGDTRFASNGILLSLRTVW
jgi:hypothetical protein